MFHKRKRRQDTNNVNLNKIQAIGVLVVLTIMTIFSLQRLLYRSANSKAKKVERLKRRQQRRNNTLSSVMVAAETTTSFLFTSSIHHRRSGLLHDMSTFSPTTATSTTPSLVHNYCNSNNRGLFSSSSSSFTTVSNRKKTEEEYLEEEDMFEFDRVDLNGWTKLDYTTMTHNDDDPLLDDSSSSSSTSPVEICMVRNRQVFVKRDDSYHLRDSYVNGNKARKMLPLNQIPPDQFPNVIVSYGGPQSNAMLALAAIVHSKNILHNNNTNNNNIPSNSQNTKKKNKQQQQHLTLEQWDALNDDHDEDYYDESFHQDDDEDYDDATTSIIGNDSGDGTMDKKRFVYYAKKLPRYLRKQPNGNLLRALSLGMELIELSPIQYNQYFGGLHGGNPKPPPDLTPPQFGSSTWIPQGGALCTIAIPGAKVLAEEIVQFWSTQNTNDNTPLSVCLPGGTCTTATFLSLEIHKILQQQQSYQHLDIQVVVIPCIGDAAYAKRQMNNLCRQAADSNINNNKKEYPSLKWMQQHLPLTLEPLRPSTTTKKKNNKNQQLRANEQKSNGYFVFGKPSKAIWDTYCEMKEEHGIHIDLLYGAPAWNLLLQHWSSSPYFTPEEGNSDNSNDNLFNQQNNNNNPIAGRKVMYIHSGGLEGISSQMTRYVHKGLIDSKQLQK